MDTDIRDLTIALLLCAVVYLGHALYDVHMQLAHARSETWELVKANVAQEANHGREMNALLKRRGR